MTSNLHTQFEKAFEKASNTQEKFPPDIMLQLYAYYKQATTGDTFSYNTDVDVRDGFKFNAWMQLRGMSADKAKEEYITLVNKILK